ncbi:MAG TPA: hypothetical protein VGC14_13995 [Rhizobium sp.]
MEFVADANSLTLANAIFWQGAANAQDDGLRLRFIAGYFRRGM